MNQLSWLIYWADIAGSAGGWFNIIAFFSLLPLLGGIFCLMASTDWAMSEEDANGLRKFAFRALCFSLPTFLVFLLLSILTPAKETVYAIAASEVGEEVINSPTMGKAARALESWLDRQISPVKDDSGSAGEGAQ